MWTETEARNDHGRGQKNMTATKQRYRDNKI